MKPYCFFLENFDGKINLDFIGIYENLNDDFLYFDYENEF